MQYSYNLESWAYLNEVFHSGFQIESLTFDPQGERVFLRLQFSDIPTYDAWNDDFNGNGISNEGDIQADSDPLAPVPGGGPAPEDTPLVPNHAYTLTVTQNGGNGDGDRLYDLDPFFNLLVVAPATHQPFPIDIARSPAGVETKFTLRALKPETHERQLDFMLYQSDFGNVSGETFRKVLKQQTLEIPRNQQMVESLPIVGDNDPKADYWKLSPLVVRAVDEMAPVPAAANPDFRSTQFYDGVDMTSRRAMVTDIGHSPNLWIMAPGGGDANEVEIEANAPFAIKLTASAADLVPEILTTAKATISFSAKTAGGGETIEDVSVLKVEPVDPGPNQVPAPALTEVKTTSYKRRDLVVNVYPIASVVDQVDANGDRVLDGNGNPVPDPNPTPPNPIPTQAALQSYLDVVFLKQLNLKCQVILHPVAPVQWDVAVAPDRLGQQLPTELPNHMRWPFTNEAERPKRGDGLFHRDRAVDREQARLVNSRVLAARQVHVFLIGGCQKMYEVAVGSSGQIEYVNKSALDGFADVPSWHAFLRGDWTVEMGGENVPAFARELVLIRLINTIAHEIGHVVVGLGHPDHPNVTVSSEAGPAPLARSPFLHYERVMASGKRGEDSVELVWKEWESGKAWWEFAFPVGQ